MSASVCANCQSQLSPGQNYCPGCGQSAHLHRLDMHHIAHDLLHSFLHADKGFIHLTRELALRPGLVSREYVEGRRKKYFNPFSYLVLMVAVSAFLTAYFHLMESGTGRSPNPVTAWVNRNINLIFFVSVPIAALFNWLLFRKSRYNYAEHLTHQAFIGGFRTMFFLLVFTPLIVWFRQHYYAMLMVYFAVWAAYATWANAQFYGARIWLSAIKTVLSFALTQIVITVLMFIGVSIWHSIGSQ